MRGGDYRTLSYYNNPVGPHPGQNEPNNRSLGLQLFFLWSSRFTILSLT